nr:type VI secretion system contractile sheath large subunit [Pseudomonadota bacterium]
MDAGGGGMDPAVRLERAIARLDALLERQVNAILHHPRFQHLEAAWRGLDYLTRQAAGAENVKVRVLNAGWRELARDLEGAIEFDQSQLFIKVYSEQFGMPGGEPFGLLVGDYAIRHRPADMAALGGVAQVAAAAFAPFVAAAHPAFFALDSFQELSLPLDLAALFRHQAAEYLAWQSLRQSADSRFVGLTLPRILLRLPYADDGARDQPFRFVEDVTAADGGGYLWGNAAYAFAAVAIQAFAASGWLADLRGVHRDERSAAPVAGGGLVGGLAAADFATDRPGLAPRYATEVFIGDYREKELSELGFIPLCHCQDTPWPAFYSSPSVQAPAQSHDSPAARANARLSAMLHYILCAARFAHYLKIIGREKVGAFARAAE